MIDEIFVDEKKETFKEEVESECVLVENEEKKPKMKFEDVVFGRKVKVFAKVNNEGFITDIDSDVFLKDTNGWVQIDEGVGDKFVYPQTMYFDESLIDENGSYRFKV